MSVLTYVLAGILLYWVVVAAARRLGLLPENVTASGPLLFVKTIRGRAFLNWLSAPRRLWRAWGNFGVGVTLVVMVLAFVFLVLSAVDQLLTPTASAVTRPRNVLVIPGVNQFLPLSVAPEILAGLAIGLVVHEGGHGLMSRVEDIDISSLGLIFFTLLPIAAFVEPDDDSRRRADRGSQVRMFAAGVTNNFAVTILAFGLLFGPVVGSIAVADGAAVGQVFPGSAAEDAGIERGDRITAVGGTPVADAEELSSVLEGTDRESVDVEVNGGETVTVERSLLVTGVVRGGPARLDAGDTIAAVNDTGVSTSNELRDALANRTVAALRTDDGSTTRFVVGSLVTVAPGGPLAEAGAPVGEDLTVTSIGGERVGSSDDLTAVLQDTEPGETVGVVTYRDGERRRYEVTLGTASGGDYGFLGVSAYPGTSGVTVSDFGTRAYPADAYLSVLGGGDSSFVQRTLFVLVLPVAGVAGAGGLPFNFAGFTGGVANFYAPSGPLGFLGGGLFLLANLLFWTGWINFNLAFFNCIPSYPLDGGHILRNGAEAVVSRLPVENGRAATKVVTTVVGVTMVVSFVLLLFGQGLLVG